MASGFPSQGPKLSHCRLGSQRIAEESGSTAAVACWRWVPASAPDPTAVPPGQAGDRCGGGPESGARFAGDSRGILQSPHPLAGYFEGGHPRSGAGRASGTSSHGLRQPALLYPTSPVLTALLEARCFSSVTVMVQKEVAQRMAAAPGSGIPALSPCSAITTPSRSFSSTCPLSCFLPQPKVTSSVVRLDIRQSPPCPVEDEALVLPGGAGQLCPAA